MRLLFFSSIFPRSYAPNRGVYCHHLCKALSAEHEVKVVSPRSWLDLLARKRPQGPHSADGYVDVKGLDVDYPLYVYPPGTLRVSYGWFMRKSVSRRLDRRVAEFQPDCIISYWTHPDGEVANRAARRAGVASVVTVGGSDVLLLTKQPRRRKQILAVLKEADAVVTVSRDMQERVIDLGVPRQRVHVVYRGVDGGVFHPADPSAARRRLGIPMDGSLLLFVGNLVPLKGVEVLLRAVERLRQERVARGERPLRLYLVGDGPSRKALEAQVATAGLADDVRFAGPVVQDKLPDWYRAADLTVLPSYSEGVPNVLRESIACGTPYVSTRVGGIQEISESPLNRLVPPGDAGQLADAISASLASPRPTADFGSQAGSWADSARKLIRVIETLPTAKAAADAGVPIRHRRDRGQSASGPAELPAVAKELN